PITRPSRLSAPRARQLVKFTTWPRPKAPTAKNTRPAKLAVDAAPLCRKNKFALGVLMGKTRRALMRRPRSRMAPRTSRKDPRPPALACVREFLRKKAPNEDLALSRFSAKSRVVFCINGG